MNPLCKSKTQLLLEAIGTLAGLVHDLGKVNKQFQQGLQGNPSVQRLRHDVLSALMFKQACRLALEASKVPSDIGWLKLGESNPKAFFQGLIDSTGHLKLPDAMEQQGPSSLGVMNVAVSRFTFLPRARETFPALQCVFFLALTHHHLIRKEQGGEQPSLWRHVHDNAPWLQENLQVEGDAPWKDDRWGDAFSAACRAILDLLKDEPNLLDELGKDHEAMLTMLTQVLRPSLILADQATSVMQEDLVGVAGDAAFNPGKLYANCGATPGAAGDSLATHLSNVGSRTARYLSHMLAPSESAFAYLRKPAEHSQIFSRPAPSSPYFWQLEAEEALSDIPDLASAPFFGAVLSAPGSGKTSGGARVLRAASGGKARFTLAVGRRSLTLQAGAAYESQLGFHPDDVTVMVGDTAARVLFEGEAASVHGGSECLSGDDEVQLDKQATTLGQTRANWLRELQPRALVTKQGGFIDNRRIELIDVPVLVATVDHLVGAVSLTRNKDAQLLLRIASSDLILDEIDDFSSADLVTIGKLVHLYGVYGRRVVIMSGSLNNFLVEQLRSLWLEGIKVHQRMTGRRVPPVTAMFSNLTPALIHRGEGEEGPLTSKGIHDFSSKFAYALHEGESKTRGQLLYIPDEDSDVWRAKIAQAAMYLHDCHATIDPTTGISVSIGVLRFNSVKHAQDMARYLYSAVERPSDPVTSVVCYHSRYPTILRALIEQELDGLLNRTPANLPKGQQFPEHPRLRAAIKHCHTLGRGGVMVLVCTTSIEEVGRDHDFDFAITEPHSERSLVQLAGRVRRHRSGSPRSANILVLDRTVNAITGKGLPYGHSGVQDTGFKSTGEWLVESPLMGSALDDCLRDAGFKEEYPSETNIPGKVTLTATHLLPMDYYQRSITPALVLQTPMLFSKRRLATLEHLKVHSAMSKRLKNVTGAPSLQEFFGSAAGSVPLPLTSVHSEMVRFREDTLETAEVRMDVKNGHLEFTKDGLRCSFGHEEVRRPTRDFMQLSDTWRAKLDGLCERRKWKSDYALDLLGCGRVRWAEHKNALFYAGIPSFNFGFHLGFSERK